MEKFTIFKWKSKYIAPSTIVGGELDSASVSEDNYMHDGIVDRILGISFEGRDDIGEMPLLWTRGKFTQICCNYPHLLRSLILS